jgi:hypothetical protein
MIAGLWLICLAAPAVAQQAPPKRSVIILPDGTETAIPASPPGMSLDQLNRLNETLNADNSAGLSLNLIPGLEVVAGSKVGFRISTKKQGYVILLDVDPTGKLSQIFPEIAKVTDGTPDASNLIKPGRPLTIPQLGTPSATFDFVAQPPGGMAIVVALLSDKPVHLVDLPDAPPPAFAPGDTLKYVRDKTRTLMVPSVSGGELQQPNWSFDGKFYLIK